MGPSFELRYAVLACRRSTGNARSVAYIRVILDLLSRTYIGTCSQAFGAQYNGRDKLALPRIAGRETRLFSSH
jgi:hypothetical protein